MRTPVLLGLLMAAAPLMAPGAAAQADRGPAACATAAACRALAEEAAAGEAYETFHDLAWRAVQLGSPRDPGLMYLLARAQSLSGRPADALVMLRRLAEAGVVTDAADSDDFRRARALPAWTEVAALVERLRAGDEDVVLVEAPPAPPPAPAAAAPAVPPAEPGAPPSPAASAPVPARSAAEITGRFAGGAFEPGGLAYDAASGRLIVGDRHKRKIVIVGDGPQRVVDLVRADSAGFLDVMALEVDARRGDLWVVSAAAGPAGRDGSPGASALHRLQLISGRPLATFPVPDEERPARFVDVAVTPEGTALALDAAGGRLYRLRPRADRLEVAARLDLTDPVSLAPSADGRTAWIAHRRGIARIDLAAGRAAEVPAAGAITLDAFERLRWHRGALVGVRTAGGAREIVRLRLDSAGRQVVGLDVLEALEPGDGAAAGLSGDDFYYLSAPDRQDRDATLIRRLRLR